MGLYSDGFDLTSALSFVVSLKLGRRGVAIGSIDRWWLNQAIHSSVASCTAYLVFHGPRR